MPEQKAVPLIGQFSGPPGNAPRLPADLPRKPPVIPEPVIMESVVAAATPGAVGETAGEGDMPDDQLGSRPRTPQEKAEAYQKGLESVGLTPLEARGILEHVLVNDVYEEDFQMGPIKVTVRTRSYKDVIRTLRYLELEKPTYAMGINDVMARYNMAASIVAYGGNRFEHPSKKSGATDEQIDDAFNKRLDFIMELPTVALQKLMQITHDFDTKIGAVFAEGAPEDF